MYWWWKAKQVSENQPRESSAPCSLNYFPFLPAHWSFWPYSPRSVKPLAESLHSVEEFFVTSETKFDVAWQKRVGKIMAWQCPPFGHSFLALHDNTLAMLLLVVSTLTVSCRRSIWKMTTPPVAQPLVVQTQAVPQLGHYQVALQRMSQSWALSCHYLTKAFRLSGGFKTNTSLT